MAFTFTTTCQIGNGTATKQSITTETGDGFTRLQLSIPDSTTDQQVPVTIDADQLQVLYMVSDEDVTVEANDGSTPDFTISLVADRELLWRASDSYFSNPVTDDVTDLYITNTSGSTAAIEIWIGADTTP